ncbi:GSCFA domain-containing protein [Celeribacter neptunius]|uniref:GSCFA family protein n=1 Tax=Celeribacter neptunius TaxID=588602 RepID=A0A1I3TPY9_9RHOB|nr:GSCFA domain-containing protein [Celeribacter neptunius]SFJ72533.1 GSCFA family protein [Celeribacter neptunius]
MGSPYDHLPSSAFWRSGVAEQDPAAIETLYVPKFPVTPDMRIMTAGSCFAQHVHRNLAARDWAVVDTEPAPAEMAMEDRARHGYGLYSARYGNVYTVRQMLQLLREAAGEVTPAEPVWQRDGRFFDAQRPNIEPTGFESAEAVMEARNSHLRAVREAIGQAEVLVFTLGLTECWQHRDSGTVYPTAPGTLAGTYDPDIYMFRNFTLPEVRDDLIALRDHVTACAPGIKMVLTVSPVPLTATATGGHVLPAAAYSKAVLRGAAGEMAQRFEDVDYVPSFEVITNPAAKGRYYKANLRSVTEEGVAAAMRMFFAAHETDTTEAADPAARMTH